MKSMLSTGLTMNAIFTIRLCSLLAVVLKLWNRIHMYLARLRYAIGILLLYMLIVISSVLVLGLLTLLIEDFKRLVI
jgi:hypothetical protein